MADKSKFFELLAVSAASGKSIRDASAAAGCSESHGYRLASTAEFRQRVNQLRAQMTAQAVGELSAGAVEAVQTLRQLLGESYEASIRIQASKAILAALGPVSELAELRARLDAIETPISLKVAQ